MLMVSTGELDLLEPWLDSDATARVRVAFPINRYAGAADSAAVYFEVAPGDRLGRHTDSAEEILYIVDGTAEAEVGDERAQVSTGDLAVVPAMVPHGLVNNGTETLRVVGFFSESDIWSTFEEPVQPMGVTTLEMGAPVPA
jgi:quercetin dioxygenase-like cupin family protein